MKAKYEIIDGVGYLTFYVTEEIGLMKLPVITRTSNELINHNLCYKTFLSDGKSNNKI